MSGRVDWKLPVLLTALLLIEAVMLLLPGKLAITGHEVDVLHATEAAIRLSIGQLQHVDFMTPLGVLAFKPISLFLEMGYGISTAYAAGNILIGLFFLPFLVWVGARRIGQKLALWFGVLVIIMITAVVYGGEQATVSMSMYYNRWGWAAVFILVAMILLPERGEIANARLDGAVIGMMLGFLLLLKITFFIALAPVVALVLIVDRDWKRLSACILTGMVICILATLLFGGFEFWRHYLLDLTFVSQTEARPRPGKEFAEVLSLPSFFPGTICLLAAIVGLRTAGFSRDGLVIFMLAPAFVYITYQNWGNDTKWLVPLGFACLLWSRRMDGISIYGWDGRTYFNVLGCISLAIIAPSFVNMTTSPIRNMIASNKDYVSVMLEPIHSGLVIERERSYFAEALVIIDGVAEDHLIDNDELTEPLQLGDFTIPRCTLQAGYFGLMKKIADDLVNLGFGNKRFTFVDVANPLPLIASLKRLDYASPWYYGGTRDADGAEFLVVPKCPVSQPTFKVYLNALNSGKEDWKLDMAREHVWVFSRR